MGPFDLKIPHHGSDVVDRELPEIQRCIVGDITGRVASGIVGNATVAIAQWLSDVLFLPRATI
jgi:hypothetical protein